MAFRKITPRELEGNAYNFFNEGWALLTAGTTEDYNTMTISWGTIGCLWNRPVCTVFVRPCRHTYKYTEAAERFTVSIFGKDEYRPQLMTLGTKSGRDMDKMNDSGLTPTNVEGLKAFEEARVILTVRKLYDQQFDASLLPDEVRNVNYKGVADDDLHRQYICVIEGVYVRE
ncbi:MAG: flavin reductase [Clostridia bacterium]|nr:flavin reductase [Clostridia bacterium]